MVMVDGATATDTDFQGKGLFVAMVSIAAFKTSIPEGLATSTAPAY